MITKYIKKSAHRIELENHLNEWLPKLSGTVLDVGSKNRRYDHLLQNKPIAIDSIADSENDIIKGDINNLRFPNEYFDSIMCIEVLEYIKSPRRALSEMYRVLKSGGSIVTSIPFVYKDHGDRMRFTKRYVRELFGSFSNVNVLHIGNAYSVVLDIVRGKIKHIRFVPARYVLYPLYLFLVLFLQRRTHPDYYSGLLIIAHK
ncbi:hypothetical protein COB64_00500 [Candidatus Wolfebacteria bacterium]|nr:MAG: hypothetical protein COB64_00500 [Candidatus Wolfebacteria bacterium]